MNILSSKSKSVLSLILIVCTWATIGHCNSETSFTKGAPTTMKTYYIGRFSIAVPVSMQQKIRSSKLGYVDLKEILWPQNVDSQEARKAEWDTFVAKTRAIPAPEGASEVIIRSSNFPGVGRWIRGMFCYDENYSSRIGKWTALMDAGHVGLWLIGDPTMVEEEKRDPKMESNLGAIARAYQPLDLDKVTVYRPDKRFYLQYGAIDLVYSEEEEAIARFEGDPLDLTLVVEMETDFTKERETQSLIEGTKALLAAALLERGGSASKVRLRKREVAGMPGEEAVLKIREGREEDLLFTWQYNGKDNSGEYPATKIEMQTPAAHLGEKLEVWDQILDSMKPMFDRQK